MTTSRGRRTLLVSFLVLVLVAMASPAEGAAQADWPGYLFGPAHSSYNADAAAITPANAASLTRYWQWKAAPPTMAGQPNASLFASPTVFAGRVYIGANTGVFYALDLATKSVVWSRFLGFVTHKT